MPIPSLTASSHLPIPCGLTGMFPCGKGKGRSKTRSSYWEPRHRSWLPPSDDWLSITDSMALFQEIWWLCHRRIFNGEVPIDNNASERAILGFCIGKKNWQMIDTINGAHSSAIIYSIAETAKANNLKPYDYFVYLLEEIPKHMDDTDRSFLDDLLPWSPNLPDGIRKN